MQEDFPGRPLASPQLPPRVTIHEHGVRYRIHFEQGHKTGFFCDQRDNRRDLARFCADRSVLDLCCYTGGFGLDAHLRGRAREVTCVDLDENAVALARENGNANSVRLSVVHADAFGYMRQMALNERPYGVIVLDPPELIADRDEIPAGKRKYFDLNVLAMSLVEPGGLLLTCSCSGLLAAADFQAVWGRGAEGGAERSAPGHDRCGRRSPGRPGRSGGRLSQSGMAEGGRSRARLDRGGKIRGGRPSLTKRLLVPGPCQTASSHKCHFAFSSVWWKTSLVRPGSV